MLGCKVKCTCQADKKEWLERKVSEAQKAADQSNMKTLYCIFRDLIGARSNSSVPVKEKNEKTLLDAEEQNEQ